MKKGGYKNIFAVFVCIILMVSFSACSKKSSNESNKNLEEKKTAELQVNWPLYEIKQNNKVKGYLLGTIHLGKPNMYPFPEKLENILKTSDAIVTEVKIKDLVTPNETVAQKYLYSDHSLTDEMSDETKELYKKKVEASGLSVDQLNNMSRLGVYQTLTSFSTGSLSAFNGVDLKLNKYLKNKNTENLAFEELEFQMEMLRKMQEEESSIDAWVENIPEQEEVISENQKLFNAYLKDGVESDFEEIIAQNSEENLEILFFQRNRNWIPKIEEIVQSKEQPFFAFGAGHLYGEQGVIELLKNKGFEVNRVETLEN